MIDLTPVFDAIVTLAVALICAFVIPWLKSCFNEVQVEEALAWVRIAVAAAEQIFQGSGRGAQKKEYVISFLEDRGFVLDEEQINLAIEAAVLELKEAVAA